MRFHSAMATLEPHNNVIAITVGTENILLVSRRLVLPFRTPWSGSSVLPAIHFKVRRDILAPVLCQR